MSDEKRRSQEPPVNADAFLPPDQESPSTGETPTHWSQGGQSSELSFDSQAETPSGKPISPQYQESLAGGDRDSRNPVQPAEMDLQELTVQQNRTAADLQLEQVRLSDPSAAQQWGAVLSSPPPRDASLEIAGELSQRNSAAVSVSDLWRSLLWLVTLVLMFLSVITVGPYLVERYQYAAAKGRMQAQYEAATDMLSQVSFKDSTLASELVVHKIRPSVVSVRAISKASLSKFVVQGTGQGSGVVLSSDGYIVTNNHVVENSERIDVTLADRREFPARIVGQDRETDLAVLKIAADDLIAAEWGDSNDLELGAAVWAMGSPFGLEQTVTRGIISGKHRRTADTLGNPNPHQDLLQTDAAINPGNSGGPLVNSHGQIVGINTSIYGDSFQGISFAVPSTLAKEIVNRLVESGEVRRGFLGVRPEDVTYKDARRLNLSQVKGALVTLVEPDSPAAQAGLRPDDVIMELDGKAIENQILLFRHIGMTEPGSLVEVKFMRDGQEKTVKTSVASLERIRRLQEPGLQQYEERRRRMPESKVPEPDFD